MTNPYPAWDDDPYGRPICPTHGVPAPCGLCDPEHLSMNEDSFHTMADEMSDQEKITALVEFGLASSRREARTMLVDMGELDD